MIDENFISGISGPRKLADRVYLMIENAIINHDLKPGEEIAESSLAERLNTSATPVREAIGRLIAEGLMEKIPNKPPRVILLGQKEICELYSIRSALEVLAISTAIKNITPEGLASLKVLLNKLNSTAGDQNLVNYRKYNRKFHDKILEIADNRFLQDMMRSLQQKIQICVTSTTHIPKLHEKGVKIHNQVVELIESGDVSRTREVMFAYYEELIENIIIHYDEIII